MEKPQPTPEHAWLQRFVGEWSFEVEVPDDPSASSAGTERVQALGPFWVISETEWGAGADVGSSRLTLGYDATHGRFDGTFVGSTMPWLWIYHGSLDESRQVLTLDTVGPSFTRPGEMGEYRDVLAFESDDVRTQRSYYLNDESDATWTLLFTVRCRRVA